MIGLRTIGGLFFVAMGIGSFIAGIIGQTPYPFHYMLGGVVLTLAGLRFLATTRRMAQQRRSR